MPSFDVRKSPSERIVESKRATAIQRVFALVGIPSLLSGGIYIMTIATDIRDTMRDLKWQTNYEITELKRKDEEMSRQIRQLWEIIITRPKEKKDG